MRISGEYIQHRDGTTIHNARVIGTPASINRAIQAQRDRQQVAEERRRHFIPPAEFVGPEKPLARAMRELMADKLSRMK